MKSQDASPILAALTAMLGRAGLEAQALDLAAIREDGGQPLVVALIGCEQASVTLLAATVALEATTVH